MSDYIAENFIEVFTDSEEAPTAETETIVGVGPFLIDRIHIHKDAVFIHAVDDVDEKKVLVIRNDDSGRPRLFVSPDLLDGVDAFDLP